MKTNSLTSHKIYKERLKRGMLIYPKFRPYNLRFYLKPRQELKIKKLISILKNPIEYFKRLITFYLFVKGSHPIRVGEDGNMTFSANQIKNGKKFLDKICTFVDKKRKKNTNNDNKYIISIEEVVKHPFILDFALSEDLIKIASNYLKTVPILYAVQLWQGKPNEIKAGSPCFHLDGLDTSCLRVYMYLNDVSDDNGPFSILPKPDSKIVLNKTKYSGGVIADKEVYSLIDCNLLNVIKGPKGTMLAGDTTQCFHYGSRIKKKERLVIIFTYASFYHNDPEIKLTKKVLRKYKPKNRIQKMLINGAK